MITYRHIPTDWNTFIPPDLPRDDLSRRIMMCGRKARHRLSGIPGISQQHPIVRDRPGWCPGCIVATIRQIESMNIPDVTLVRAVYEYVLEECRAAAYIAVENGII